MTAVGCITHPHSRAYVARQVMTAVIISKGWSIAMKKIIGIAIVATALASPAFAQSFDPDNGTGNIVAGNTVAAPAPAGTTVVARHLGEAAYAMSARGKVDSAPEGWRYSDNTTGGGSPGYNKMLRNW